MGFEGVFWLLWEDEPIDLEHTRLFDFRGGAIFDGRTGEHRGTYEETAAGVDATFSERNGAREVVAFRSGMTMRKGSEIIAPPPFDPAADSYTLTFSTAEYEAYAAARAVNDDETDEEKDDRRDMEVERFGIVPMLGHAYRDCAEVRGWGEANRREYDAACRRAEMHAVDGG